MIAAVLPSLFALLLIAVWIYALIDVITTDDALVRNLPKLVWILVVVLLWVIGAILWFAAGRPVHSGLGLRPGARRDQRSGGGRRPPRDRRPLGPEDEEGWSDYTT